MYLLISNYKTVMELVCFKVCKTMSDFMLHLEIL